MKSHERINITYEKRNILECLKESVDKYPDRTAVVSGDGQVRLTYGEMNERANRVANALADLGVASGLRVAIFQPNNWRYPEEMMGIMKIGGIYVPMNFRLKSPEAFYILTETGASVLFFDARYTSIFEEIRPYLLSVKHYICTNGAAPEWAINYDDLLAHSTVSEPAGIDLNFDSICTICYTSGTTGLPKGSICTHRNMMVNFYDETRYFREVSAKLPELGYGVMMIIVPLYHIAGIVHLFTSMVIGQKIVIPEAFTPERYMQIVEKERVTCHFFVPTMFALTLDHPDFGKYDLRSLRYVTYGAMPMPPDLLMRVLKEFPPHVLYLDAFGCTECNAILISKMPEDHILTGSEEEIQKKIKRLSGVGRPMRGGIVTRIVDEHGREVPTGVVGHIVSRGDKVSPGYWRNPEQTALAFDKDGWFHSGDMGWRDEDGYIYFADRSKDMINRGGENIFPLEVERIIIQHPKVAEAAVFGAPDPTWGAIVVAAVVLHPNETMGGKELIDFCKGKLASFKVPSMVEFIAALPRTFEGGKVQRRVLRENYIKRQKVQ